MTGRSNKKKLYYLSAVLFVLLVCVIGNLAGCGEAPAVPHSFTSASADSCRTCHQSKDSGAPLVDHSDRNNCLRCHDGKPVVAYEKKDTSKAIRL